MGRASCFIGALGWGSMLSHALLLRALGLPLASEVVGSAMAPKDDWVTAWASVTVPSWGLQMGKKS